MVALDRLPRTFTDTAGSWLPKLRTSARMSTYHSLSGPRSMDPRTVPAGVFTKPLCSFSGPSHSTHGITSLGCLGSTSKTLAKYLTAGSAASRRVPYALRTRFAMKSSPILKPLWTASARASLHVLNPCRHSTYEPTECSSGVPGCRTRLPRAAWRSGPSVLLCLLQSLSAVVPEVFH